jgi:hypothetical protein
MFERKERPYYWHEQFDRDRNHPQKEYHDHGMLLVYEIVAQAGATVRDAAIGEEDIELAKQRGEVDYEESVKEAYGCSSALV